MGYNTQYRLEAKLNVATSPEEAIKIFVQENEDASYWLSPDGSTYIEGTWYEHEAALRILSREHPHLLFSLYGEGEEAWDVWVKYFSNGRMQVSKAEIRLDPFDPAKLK